MNFRGQISTSSRKFNYSSATTQPPRCKSFQYDVPVGTVASRIRLLQSLSNPISAHRPPSFSIRRRENSRTGFGRRLNSRFAEPASRNNYPDEHTQVETTHSFLGLNTPRKNHEEKHAMTSHRGIISYQSTGIQGQEALEMAGNKTIFYRTPGIHGQIEPQGVKQRVQYDAASPWPVLSKAESLPSTYKNGKRSLSPTSASQQDIHEPSRATNNLQHGTVSSEASILTTSTIRRQSVRDLFQDYGIERPARLVSSDDTARGMKETSRQARPHRYCHVCLWITIRPSTKCWRCGHRHCADCDALSPILEMESRQSNADNTTNISREKSHSVSELGPQEGRSQVEDNGRKLPPRPRPKPTQESNRKPASPPVKFPSFDAQVPATPKDPRTPSLPNLALPGQPRTVRMLSGHRVTTSVKESPFVIADMLSVPMGISISSPCEERHGRHSHRANWRHRHRSLSSSPCSVVEEYKISTRHDQNKHRHSKRQSPRTYHLYEETDNGYVADRSRVEDMVHPHSHSYQTRPPSQPSHPRPDSRHSCVQKIESQHKHHEHDLVECHGYPRTGHDRRGSPVASGVIGECQHCLNDCQCSACQTTQHSVRCCVHDDHQSIAHHHHSFRKENVANSKDVSAKPLRNPSPVPHSQTTSHARTMSTVIPPKSQRKEISPTGTEEPRELPASQSRATNQELRKSHSFLKSKKSTSIAEVSKGQTPPHWVSSPHRASRSTLGSTLKEKPKQQSIDHAYSITPSPKPPSPFQEISTSPPPQDHSSKYEQLQNYDSTSPKHPVIERKRIQTPSRCSTPQRNAVSPPGSRRASRRLSALFQLRERNAVPLLNQKLMEHQQELKRTEKQCDERAEGVSQEPGVTSNQNSRNEQHGKHFDQKQRPASVASSKNETKRSMKLKLKIADKEPSPICAGEEHRLSDDSVLYNERTRSPNADDMHECLWKRLFLEEQHEREDRETGRDGDCGIQGVTVLVHFEGRDDYVFKGELSSSGTLRVRRN